MFQSPCPIERNGCSAEKRDQAAAFVWPSDRARAASEELDRVCDRLEQVMEELDALKAYVESQKAKSKARQMAGIAKARAEGRRMGRAKVIDDRAVAEWRWQNSETITETAKHFGISVPSVKRAWREAQAKGWLKPKSYDF